MITVKEYAENRGKSVQAVYQQMKRKENSARLEGHIHVVRINNKDTKCRDDEGVEILDEASQKSIQVVLQTNDKERIEELENENKLLLLELASVNKKLNEVRDTLDEERERIHQLEEENVKLLESSRREDVQKPEQEEAITLDEPDIRDKGFFAKLAWVFNSKKK